VDIKGEDLVGGQHHKVGGKSVATGDAAGDPSFNSGGVGVKQTGDRSAGGRSSGGRSRDSIEARSKTLSITIGSWRRRGGNRWEGLRDSSQRYVE